MNVSSFLNPLDLNTTNNVKDIFIIKKEIRKKIKPGHKNLLTLQKPNFGFNSRKILGKVTNFMKFGWFTEQKQKTPPGPF